MSNNGLILTKFSKSLGHWPVRAINIALLGISVGCLSTFNAFVVISIIISLLMIMALILWGVSIEHIAYLTLLLAPLNVYRAELPLVNLSGFRILLIVLIISYVFSMLARGGKIRKNPMYLFLSLHLFSTLLALGVGEFTSRTGTIFLTTVAGLALCFVFGNILDNKEKLYRAIHVFLTSYLIYVFFAVYTYYIGYIGGKVVDIPFRDLLPFKMPPPGHLEGGRMFVATTGALQRLSLPTGSPPRLSIFLAAGVVLLMGLALYAITNQRSGRRWIPYVLFASILTIMTYLTMARTGWIALIGGLLILTYLWKSKLLFYRLSIKFLFITVVTLFLIALIVIVIPLPILVPIERVTTTLEGLERHWVTRLEALSIFYTDIKTAFIGVGLSNYQLYARGIHSHSAFTTVLAERGLIGSLLYWLLYFYSFLFLYRSAKRNDKDPKWQSYKRAIVAALFVVIFGSLLYEFLHEVQVWIIIALATAMVGLEKYKESQ